MFINIIKSDIIHTARFVVSTNLIFLDRSFSADPYLFTHDPWPLTPVFFLLIPGPQLLNSSPCSPDGQLSPPGPGCHSPEGR